jgi:hypothetical protein
MRNRINILDLDDAKVGMVLAAPIFDGRGGILLPSETELTETLLTGLRRRGVDSICIANGEITEEELFAEREYVRLRLSQLFRKSTGHVANELKSSVLTYRIGGTE